MDDRLTVEQFEAVSEVEAGEDSDVIPVPAEEEQKNI